MISSIFLWIAPSSPGGGSANPLITLLPFILIIAIFYFLIIRPQSRRQKEHKKMLEELKKGDMVVAAGGIVGTIAGIKEKENIVILKIDENVKIEVLRSAISSIISRE